MLFLLQDGYLKPNVKLIFFIIKIGNTNTASLGCLLIELHTDIFIVCRFWSLLSQFRNSVKVCGLPLVSSFGRGFGDKVSIDGKVRISINFSKSKVSVRVGRDEAAKRKCH